MRTSNKILLSIGVVLFIFIIISLISVRVGLDRAVEAGGGVESYDKSFDGKMLTQSYDIEDFSNVKITGGWSVSLREGEYMVNITFPEQFQDKVKINSQGSVLSLDTTGLIDFRGSHFKAEIQMPRLEALTSQGGMTASLKGFEGDSLSIESGGGVHLKALDCTYNDLDLQLSGGIQGDLDGLTADNIHIKGNGAVDLKIRMNGGTLSGEVNGAANIYISGRVSQNTLKVQGVSNVEYQN